MVNYNGVHDKVFQALADPTRREMIARLAREPMSVSQLSEPFDISAPAVSKHVRVLEASGLLRREIKGRRHVCHLRGDGLAAAYSWLEEQRRFWEQSLDGLERYFRKQKRSGGTLDDER
jgi:DNA-binding transcriptional ArsR family regulator